MAVHDTVGACHQHEIAPQRAGCGGTGGDALDRQLKAIWLGAWQRGVLDRYAGQPGFSRKPHGLGHMIGGLAKTVFKIPRNRNIDRRDQIAGVGKASSRLIVPISGRPSVNACAADDVAMAGAPSPTSILALPMSQALARMNGSPFRCGARNAVPGS